MPYSTACKDAELMYVKCVALHFMSRSNVSRSTCAQVLTMF